MKEKPKNFLFHGLSTALLWGLTLSLSFFQISELQLPGETKDFNSVYGINYIRGSPGKQESITTVTHCDGVKVVYQFTPQMLPQSVKYFDQNESLVKTKTFDWTSNQWLNSIRITDGQQRLLSEKNFQYDSFGNPISEILKGGLAGNEQIDSCEIKRLFSLDGRNLLLSKQFSNGKIVSYTYLPETHLVTSCLTKDEKGACLLREFREYDDSYNLLKVIEDDGESDQKDDLSKVSQRKITAYILRQQAPFLHMPEWVESKYLENGKEKLFQRTQLIYDPFGNVAKENVYDAQGHFAYTIEKQYDKRGCLLSETNAIGQKANYTYDNYGREKNSTNFSRNLTISTAYDFKGRVTNVYEAGADKIYRNYDFFYDQKDRITKKTDSYGQSTSYLYDHVVEKPIEITTPSIYSVDGEIPVIKKASYDALGRKINTIDPNGNSTSYRYNAYGSPIEIIHPDQSKETFKYTTSGLLASQTLQGGLTIDYLYNTLEKLVLKAFSFGGELIGKEEFEYKGDNLLRSYDKEGHLTQYGYDGAGRKIFEERGGIITTYQYDSLGNLAIICSENADNTLYLDFVQF